jgi:hypothetical protein
MKNIVFIISLLIVVLTACQQEQAPQDNTLLPPSEIKNPNSADNPVIQGYPAITFEKTNHDFGTIQQGEVVRYKFVFTNTGDAPLIISNTQASCGCTVSDYPKQPISPGEQGEIPVEFDSKGRSNQFSKTITIYANTNPNTTQVSIEGFIETK